LLVIPLDDRQMVPSRAALGVEPYRLEEIALGALAIARGVALGASSERRRERAFRFAHLVDLVVDLRCFVLELLWFGGPQRDDDGALRLVVFSLHHATA